MTASIARLVFASALAAGAGLWAIPEARAEAAAPECDEMAFIVMSSDNDSDRKARACIDELSQRIAQASGADKARLLARRARQHLSLLEDDADPAFADYAEALSLTPDDAELRYSRAQLFLLKKRGEEALRDADTLLARHPGKLRYFALKGWSLSLLKRDQEAITVYSNAIALAQSCAEASIVQRKVNELRHAFDPIPTKEEMLAEMQDRSRPLYDIPDPAVAALGFSCAPTDANSFEDLVVMKEALYGARAESYRALGNKFAALRDFKYAVSISSVPSIASMGLCALEVDMNDDYSAGEDCRLAFDGNSFGLLTDPARSAKIGSFLLRDGDLKGACRLAFPGFLGKSMMRYLEHADVKALQRRLRAAMQGGNAARCEDPFGIPGATPAPR